MLSMTAVAAFGVIGSAQAATNVVTGDVVARGAYPDGLGWKIRAAKQSGCFVIKAGMQINRPGVGPYDLSRVCGPSRTANTDLPVTCTKQLDHSGMAIVAAPAGTKSVRLTVGWPTSIETVLTHHSRAYGGFVAFTGETPADLSCAVRAETARSK